MVSEKHGRKHVHAVEHARLQLLQEWLGWFDKPPPG
jgi:hypothetical protein